MNTVSAPVYRARAYMYSRLYYTYTLHRPTLGMHERTKLFCQDHKIDTLIT